jgi:uncharacterized sporulation protein YeaH/YhbH (DUF444 family)
MGIRDDLRRFEEIGRERRMDLESFIEEHEMRGGPEGTISVPIRIVDLPEFEYAQRQRGGVAQGEEAEQGDPVEPQEPDDGEPGDEAGDHEYYEMDPEEFAEALDERFDLDLDPKGKQVAEVVEGDYTDVARTGPNSTLDVDHLYKEGLKRTLATNFDEEYLREVLRVHGVGPDKAFRHARDNSMPVSRRWLDREYDSIENTSKYTSIDEIPSAPTTTPPLGAVNTVDIRRDDEQYRHPETEEKYEQSVVVVNIRDVSGSMDDDCREMVERTFTPLDWYLTGKYENAEFVYIAHDREAWEVDRDEFFGITSGGGTKVSSAYELAQEILEERYPYSQWNRYVFGAGDGDNSFDDTVSNVLPMMDRIDANLHGYVEVDAMYSTDMTNAIEDTFGPSDGYETATVRDNGETMDAVETLLTAASQSGDNE